MSEVPHPPLIPQDPDAMPLVGEEVYEADRMLAEGVLRGSPEWIPRLAIARGVEEDRVEKEKGQR